jgi:hypothetical protein
MHHDPLAGPQVLPFQQREVRGEVVHRQAGVAAKGTSAGSGSTFVAATATTSAHAPPPLRRSGSIFATTRSPGRTAEPAGAASRRPAPSPA